MFVNQKSKSWMLFLFLLAGCLVVLAMRQLNLQPEKKTTTFSTIENVVEKKQVQEPYSEKEVPSDFPIPAKKLHKVITDSGESSLKNNELDKRVEKLNSDLADIQEKLTKHGFDVPDKRSSENSSSSGAASRLHAIKEHLARN